MQTLQQAYTSVIQWFTKANPDLNSTSTSLARNTLHSAVVSGDLKSVKTILARKGALASSIDAHECTPLHLAAARGDVQVIKVLLEQNLTACLEKDAFGMTPLYHAVIHDHVKVIDLLIESCPEAVLIKNPVIQTVNRVEVVIGQETVLHAAVHNSTKLKTVRKLIDCLHPQPEGMQLLHDKDKDGHTVLEIAAREKKFKIMKYLLHHEDLKIQTALQRKALRLVTEKERDSILSHYVDKVKQDKGVEWRSERVETIMVVATLIAGIAFQAAINPPGGVWGEESKIDSAVEPITFAYYMGKMFGHQITKDWRPYIKFNSDPLRNVTMSVDGGKVIHISRNQSVEDIAKFVTDLQEMILNYSVNALGGIIVEEEGFNQILTSYNTSSGGEGIYPYIMRYSGFPILGYTYPMHYVVYMVSNTVALLICVTTILLVMGGFMSGSTPSQIRLLVFLVCFSLALVTYGYLTIFLAMTPDYFRGNPVDISMVVYGLVWIVCFISWLICKIFSRLVKSKKKIQYKSTWSSYSFWKLVVFVLGLAAFFLTFRFTMFPSFYRQLRV